LFSTFPHKFLFELRLTLSFHSYPFDSEAAIFYGIISDSVENEAQAFNISRRLLHIFQMRIGPELWKNGVSHGNQRTHLDLEGKMMAHLFEIICQNFETNLDSILGLHEDISIRQVVGPTYLEEICTAWKEFLDSLPTPRLAVQAPSRMSWAGRPQEKQPDDAAYSPRCLLWYKSSHKVVLMASSPRLCHEDCLLLRDYIQFLHHPRASGSPPAAAHSVSIDALRADDLVSSFVGLEQPIHLLKSSALASADFSCAGGSASEIRISMDEFSSSVPNAVYLGQIDERSGDFVAGKQRFRLYQKILFEDKDDFCILQSLFEDVPSDDAIAQALKTESGEKKSLSESERDSSILFAAVEKFKKKLAKSFPSNPYSVFAVYNMESYTMAYPGLVQFLCINR
jgi:hypothetical protein